MFQFRLSSTSNTESAWSGLQRLDHNGGRPIPGLLTCTDHHIAAAVFDGVGQQIAGRPLEQQFVGSQFHRFRDLEGDQTQLRR